LRIVSNHEISANWPSMMRVPVVRGRAFTEADRANAPKVVLVGETAARRLWPGEDPIGKPLNLGIPGFAADTARVVGVVGDVRYTSPDSAPGIDVYVSYLQMPDMPVTMLVRTAGDPLALVASLRRAVHGVAPNAPVYDARPLVQRIGDSMALARFGTSLLTSFATVALVLAMLGVYGVLAFTVVQRTREIGVRLALGATPTSVVQLVVGRGVVIAVAGGIVGIVGAHATTRVLRSLLYDVAPSDPATYVGIIVLLVAAVIVASWIPARQASRVAPAEALRVD
jgi:predicted permease